MSASKGFGAESLNDGPVSFSRNRNAAAKPALSNGEFLRQSCATMKIAFGPRNNEDCPHGVTAQRYAPATGLPWRPPSVRLTARFTAMPT